jgi:PII-like signaling protein
VASLVLAWQKSVARRRKFATDPEADPPTHLSSEPEPAPTPEPAPEQAERLTIYLAQTDHHHRVPTYVEIVGRARKARLAGATVISGAEGFGASSRVHPRHKVSVVDDVPVVVTIVERPNRIDAFLASLEDIDLDGLMVRQPVEIVIGSDRARI